MTGWTLDDIPWEAFDASRVDPEIIPIVKAASVVESNAHDYRDYLNNVFADDVKVTSAITGWADEEVQHGVALGRWAQLADPTFNYDESLDRFRANFSLPLDCDSSVRGSRTGEMIARCMVETGTSSYYNALAAATDEPVLKAICERIAEDEYAHYCLFHRHMTRYMEREHLGMGKRLRVAFGRIAETEDDELATAYHAANDPTAPYDREKYAALYASTAAQYYTPGILEQSVEMIFHALGLKSGGIWNRILSRLGWAVIRAKTWQMSRGVAA